jgi:hypothetical protein
MINSPAYSAPHELGKRQEMNKLINVDENLSSFNNNQVHDPHKQKLISTNVINISLDDLTGGEGFVYSPPIKTNTQFQEVLAYIDRCNIKHQWLMAQVAATRLQCRRVMYS